MPLRVHRPRIPNTSQKSLAIVSFHRPVLHPPVVFRAVCTEPARRGGLTWWLVPVVDGLGQRLHLAQQSDVRAERHPQQLGGHLHHRVDCRAHREEE